MKMKRETQAFRLASLVRRHIQYPTYELVLPHVLIQSKKLKKLSRGHVVLTGFNRLGLLLVDGEKICANVQLKKMDNIFGAEIVQLAENTIEQCDSKKYENIKISFGSVESKELEIGQMIDIAEIDLGKVTLVSKDRTVAEGSLVIVDKEIAIAIEKVK